MSYFFPFGEIKGSFSNLLTTANNYRKILCDFFLANKPPGIVHWHPEIPRKLVIICSKNSKFWTQYGHFWTRNILNQLSTLNMHLIINNAFV